MVRAADLVVGQAVLALDAVADLGPVRRHDAGRPEPREALAAADASAPDGAADGAAPCLYHSFWPRRPRMSFCSATSAWAQRAHQQA